jgi:hypothetical protein
VSGVSRVRLQRPCDADSLPRSLTVVLYYGRSNEDLLCPCRYHQQCHHGDQERDPCGRQSRRDPRERQCAHLQGLTARSSSCARSTTVRLRDESPISSPVAQSWRAPLESGRLERWRGAPRTRPRRDCHGASCLLRLSHGRRQKRAVTSTIVTCQSGPPDCEHESRATRVKSIPARCFERARTRVAIARGWHMTQDTGLA